MRILADGARRRSTTHEVANEKIEEVMVTPQGEIKFFLRTYEDPGIAKGLYDLTIHLSKDEVIKLYNKAILADHEVKLRELRDLKKRISTLENRS